MKIPSFSLQNPPPLDPGFVPAVLWRRAYRADAAADPAGRRISLILRRPDGTAFLHNDRLLSASPANAGRTLVYVERLLKFLLWQKGGSQVLVSGADDVAAELARVYAPGGARAFDAQFIGTQIYREEFSIRACREDELPEPREERVDLGRNLEGCRIGFDLGGSDRKAAAVIDGEVVFSEEIPWSPYFESDPTYHIEGVHDSLRRAAEHLPRVDAIGGSAAGVYVDNEVRAGSLFRGVPRDAFEARIRRMFFTLQERWNGVPFEVANDGEVTALAGSMSLRETAILGISMGTSQAGGYVTPSGTITSWLNELAFAPIDYRADSPRDEWSGDCGCGVQYFSQQAVGRLANVTGMVFPIEMPLPERLVAVQALMEKGDERARAVFETIGVYLGCAVAQYAEFYDLRTVLVLGRVSSGTGGDMVLERARGVLSAEFPELAERIRLCMPDEKSKRHGQAVAAASLPSLVATRVT